MIKPILHTIPTYIMSFSTPYYTHYNNWKDDECVLMGPQRSKWLRYPLVVLGEIVYAQSSWYGF